MADTLVDYKRGFMSMEVQRIKEKQSQSATFKGTFRGKNNKIQGPKGPNNKFAEGGRTISDVITKQLRQDYPQGS